MKKQNSKLKMFFLVATLFALLALAGETQAADYYAHPSGSGTACSLASPCSLSTLNTKLQAGDTGHLRGGIYTQQIAPSSNGIGEEARITYARYSEEVVNINYSGGDQAELTGKSYITISGLKFNNSAQYWVDITDSNHITIVNCEFTVARGYSGIRGNSAQYAKIQNNHFNDATWCKGVETSSCPGDLMSGYSMSYCLIENNYFGKAAHYGYGVSQTGDRTVIRRNTFDNQWHGNTGIYPIYNSDAKNMISENIIKNGGSLCAENLNSGGCAGTEISDWTTYDQRGYQVGDGASNNIVRGNIIYNNGSNVLSSGQTRATNNNRIYNNTFDQDELSLYLTDWGTNYQELSGNVFKNNSVTRAVTYGLRSAIDTAKQSTDINFFINNNFYGNANNRHKSVTASDSQIGNDIAGQWAQEFDGNMSNDPRFTDWNSRDYTLQPTSSLIDAGAFLTTTSNSGSNSTSMTVADAEYFMDGWGIVEGDVIKLQNGQESQVTAINYLTNQITLASPISWTQGMGVALGFEGSAPDIGAKEYTGAEDTQAPGAPGELSVK